MNPSRLPELADSDSNLHAVEMTQNWALLTPPLSGAAAGLTAAAAARAAEPTLKINRVGRAGACWRRDTERARGCTAAQHPRCSSWRLP